MNRIEVLSVDPGEKTLGALHPEAAACLAAGSRIIAPRESSICTDTLSFLTAVRHPSMLRMGFSLLLLRCLFGAALIVGGAYAIDPQAFAADLSQGTAFSNHWLALVQIAAGSLVCLGFSTRLVCLALAAVCGTLTFTALESGTAFEPYALPLFGALVFAVMGPGCISFDCLVQKGINKWRQHRNDPARLAAKRLSYEAFKYSSH